MSLWSGESAENGDSLWIEAFFILSSDVTYQPASTSFEDLIQLIPARGNISTYRFITADKPFELRVGRNQINIVFLSFCVPDGKTTFWPCIRTIESLTSQRAVVTLAEVSGASGYVFDMEVSRQLNEMRPQIGALLLGPPS
jgi:hypothetical protein